MWGSFFFSILSLSFNEFKESDVLLHVVTMAMEQCSWLQGGTEVWDMVLSAEPH